MVFALAWLLTKALRISGAESLSVAGNIFLGQKEKDFFLVLINIVEETPARESHIPDQIQNTLHATQIRNRICFSLAFYVGIYF